MSADCVECGKELTTEEAIRSDACPACDPPAVSAAARTVTDLRAIAEDVLTNRRSHDTCDRGECFYPAVMQLAEGVLAVTGRPDSTVTDLETTALDALQWFGNTAGMHSRVEEAVAAVRELARQARDNHAEARSLVAELGRATEAMEDAEADRDSAREARANWHTAYIEERKVRKQAEADRDRHLNAYCVELQRRMETETERDRYREALKQIEGFHLSGASTMTMEMQRIARAALATPDTPPVDVGAAAREYVEAELADDDALGNLLKDDTDANRDAQKASRNTADEKFDALCQALGIKNRIATPDTPPDA